MEWCWAVFLDVQLASGADQNSISVMVPTNVLGSTMTQILSIVEASSVSKNYLDYHGYRLRFDN